ncbi:hypothetical protein [Sphingomonas quercus]|uniref:Sel1 repeat family protein n=1 Tax=Sphingomonas quercus TaxID=2842451 RepID=A0ABS6BGB0_9SPHN|nr:hypothetical protein [Sphingomonas quercus]MBU3077209.1 hypothetical protein [Sphingomonas quercus]
MASQFAYVAHRVDDHILSARHGDADAQLDLGRIYASGAGGTIVDLIEAHKWFNLAALNGCEEAQYARAEIAGEMSPREIATAQKAARAFLATAGRA